MATIEPQLETPLAPAHRSAGANMGVWFGCALPDDFGNAREEQRYANQTVALIDKNYRTYLALTGPDRVRYLNAIVTNNVKDLREGQGTVSLLLNPQGHIVAELEARPEAESLFCISYAMIREKLIEWLDKYIIMDDVTLADVTERYGTLGLEGPQTADLLKRLTGVDVSALEELASVPATVSGLAIQLEKRSPTQSTPGAEFLVDREQLPLLWDVLRTEVHNLGGGAMGCRALSAQRLAQGVPWFGYDFGEKQIPHEAGLEQSHISYIKGCYTGQEIVERVRSRGQVNRQRVSLIFSGVDVPESGTPLLAREGNEAGYVTRAAESWYPAGIFGMAYVRKENAAPGTQLSWSGGTAEVISGAVQEMR